MSYRTDRLEVLFERFVRRDRAESARAREAADRAREEEPREAARAREKDKEEWNQLWGRLASKMGTVLLDIVAPSLQLVPVFSSLRLPDDLIPYLTKNGIYALTMGADAMQVLNRDAVSARRRSP